MMRLNTPSGMVLFHDFRDDLLDRDRAERRLARRLPDDDVSADGGDHRVPRPDGDGEVIG